MKKATTPSAIDKSLPYSAAQIHAFRLRRHHLLDRTGKDLVTICRDVCGVQAQIMSAAQLQLWARNPAITPAMVNDALWQKRSLVKTTLMRQTLHLVPSDEFSLYVAAQRKTRVRAVLRVMARVKITPDEAEGLSSLILGVLDAGPATHRAIAAAVRLAVLAGFDLRHRGLRTGGRRALGRSAGQLVAGLRLARLVAGLRLARLIAGLRLARLHGVGRHARALASRGLQRRQRVRLRRAGFGCGGGEDERWNDRDGLCAT